MNPGKTKILLADDDEDIVDSLKWILEGNGYNVNFTYDGDEVISSLLKDSPNLVILDTWMSGVDGRDVCKELKTNPETKHVPVLMISASREIRKSALEAGADAFLAKPFEMKELVNMVAALIS